MSWRRAVVAAFVGIVTFFIIIAGYGVALISTWNLIPFGSSGLNTASERLIWYSVPPVMAGLGGSLTVRFLVGVSWPKSFALAFIAHALSHWFVFLALSDTANDTSRPNVAHLYLFGSITLAIVLGASLTLVIATIQKNNTTPENMMVLFVSIVLLLGYVYLIEAIVTKNTVHSGRELQLLSGIVAWVALPVIASVLQLGDTSHKSAP